MNQTYNRPTPMLEPRCDCGGVLEKKVSQSVKNPGREYFRCPTCPNGFKGFVDEGAPNQKVLCRMSIGDEGTPSTVKPITAGKWEEKKSRPTPYSLPPDKDLMKPDKLDDLFQIICSANEKIDRLVNILEIRGVVHEEKTFVAEEVEPMSIREKMEIMKQN
jgi:hypothetical protein